MSLNQRIRSDEKGNALFLILIAVVLFAALSYAITQSSRGGGAPNRETSMVASTTLMQYSAAVRTGVTRVLLRNVAPADLLFNEPSAFTANTDREVFHPDGGGVSYQTVDQNTSDSSDWTFLVTGGNVTGVGTASDDVLMMLDQVKQPICQRIVDQIAGEGSTIDTIADTMANILNGTATITGAISDGQSFGCVDASDGYVYYQVLVEQ